MNYWCQDPGQLFQEHLEWGRHCPHSAMLHKRPSDNEGRPLRIGYLSPDFCSHPVAFFIEPLLARHDRSSFEVFCYSDVAHPDGITTHFRRLVPAWRDIRHLSDDELARRIHADRIDILVDVAGHTANNRLRVFACKPAPLQVTWLGYPNTTGLAAMDYRLTDAWADPPGETEHWHSETLIRLQGGFLCYRPLEGVSVTAPPCLTTRHVTFGSFNNLAKVTPEVIAVWSRLLRRVPTARLLLKTKPLRDKDTQEAVYEQFARYGVDRGRVDLIGWVEKMGDHMGLYGRVDIALDTFPYNGTTTTCEALWMGVPVVTLAGGTHAGRVGVSLLSRIGLSEFIAGTPDEYIELAVQLANDRERLDRLRNHLRGQVAASSLCDAESFARNVEASYRTIWQSQKQLSQGRL
jgi:predicted O-linked N-acetylglucosamine transferase (SPINDLY family)